MNLETTTQSVMGVRISAPKFAPQRFGPCHHALTAQKRAVPPFAQFCRGVWSGGEPLENAIFDGGAQ